MTPKDLAGLGARGGVNAIREHKVKRLALAVRPPPTESSSDGAAGLEVGALTQSQVQVQLDEEAAIVAGVLGETRELERGDHGEVAALLFTAIERLGKATPVFDCGELWRYSPGAGLWVAVDKDQVVRLVGGIAGMPIRASEGKEPKTFKASGPNADGVHKYLVGFAKKGATGPGFFDKCPEGVAVTNGFLVVDDGAVVLRAHDSGQRVRDRVQLAFDAHVRAPAWDKALAEWFKGDDASEKISFLQEFAGGALFGLSPRYQRCAVCLGAGANGKSALLDVVSALFPEGTVTSIPPQDVDDERMGAGLDRSRLNVVTEMPERAILESGGFKAAVVGDRMTRRRAYGREFTFRPRAGHLFAANHLPPVVDTSDGFWRRLVIVKFDNRFEGDQVDTTLADRILRDELPGVLAWAVRGAARLVQNNCYTEVPSSKAELGEWRGESNPVALWREARCEPGGWTDASTLYRDYRDWAPANGFMPLSVVRFGRRMKELPLVEHRKISRIEYGVRLKLR